MSSRRVGVVTRSLRRQQQANIVGQIPTEHEQDQNDDDDVVESTASAFDRVCSLLLLLLYVPPLTTHCACVQAYSLCYILLTRPKETNLEAHGKDP